VEPTQDALGHLAWWVSRGSRKKTLVYSEAVWAVWQILKDVVEAINEKGGPGDGRAIPRTRYQTISGGMADEMGSEDELEGWTGL